MIEKQCEYGCDQIATYYFKSSKKWCCSKQTSTCPGMKSKNSKKVKDHISSFLNPNDRWKNGHPKGNKNGKSLKGKTFEEIYGTVGAILQKQKIADTLAGVRIYDQLTDEQKAAHSEKARKNINKRYEAGWMPRAGRCKKIKYYSPIAGFVSLDGTWELTAAQYFDKMGYTWERNTKRFKYLDNEKERYYTPDFWVEELNSYIEVKVHETDLDRLKWSQFTDHLLIWKKDKIESLAVKILNI